jgi:hypothetical protein
MAGIITAVCALLAGVTEDGRTLVLADGETAVAFAAGEEHPSIGAVPAPARATLRPARLAFGRATLRTLVRNIADPGGALDEALAVLRVTGEDGAEIALLVFGPVAFDPGRPALVFASAPLDQAAEGDFAGALASALAALEPLDGPLRVEGRRVRIGTFTVEAVPGRLGGLAATELRARAEREAGGPAAVVSLGGDPLPALPPGEPPPAAEVVRIQPLAPPSPRSGVSTRRVWMRSPRPSGCPANDTFPVEEWVPKEPAPAAILVLPMWKGGILLAERVLASHLAERGYLAAILPLPYMMQRSTPGVMSGDYTVSSDLVRTEAALRQGLADVKAAASRLSRLPEVRGGRLGIAGISLGAHVAAVACRDDPRFSAGLFVMAGGDPASIVWAGSRETRRMKEELVARGVTLPELRRFFLPMDPAAFPAPPAFPGFARYRGILMVNGTLDTVVPPENARLLRTALGEPEILWFSEDHYSMAKRVTELLAAADRHLDAIFR